MNWRTRLQHLRRRGSDAHSPGSRVPRGSEPDDRGAATAEFVMVTSLLIILTLAVIQLTSFVHVRNTLIDAASTGARFGVLHDRTAEDGAARTRELVSSSIAGNHAEDVSYEHLDTEEGRILRITVRAQVPLMGIGPGVGALEVHGRAHEID